MISPGVTGVIIADDDPLIRSVLRAAFDAIDVNVFVTSDGLEAVGLASRIRASLIILDLNMPHLNGLLACQRIRQLPGNERTPIVILTSIPGKDAECACAHVGATAFFAKPFRPTLLLQELSQFLPISDETRDLIRRKAESAGGIVASAPKRVEGSAPNSGKSGCGGTLDRGKDILDVLRG